MRAPVVPVSVPGRFPFLQNARRGNAVALAVALMLAGALELRALIVMGDEENPLPPALPGAGNAASWVGELRDPGTPGPLATPIGPRHFLTAAHLEFGPGDPFWFRGVRHTVVARQDLPDSDLAVGEVTPELPFHVELYPRPDEVRRRVLVLGKGRWKGDAVTREGVLRGWRYAETGMPGIRWGTNQIRRVLVADPESEGLRGEYLSADFDAEGGADEVHFTRGDSGAPVFLQDCGVWKLAAVASAVDGPFVPVEEPDGVPFLAALFDARGFARVDGEGELNAIDGGARPVPTSWYAARVSSRVSELRALAGVPGWVLPPAPADRFVWGQAELNLSLGHSAGLRDGTGAGVGAVACGEDVSAAQGRVEWNGADVRYTAPGRGVPVDSFRYVVAGAEGVDRASGRVLVISRELAGALPRVAFDPDGAVVVVWPVGTEGGMRGEVPRVEHAESASGPWARLETVVARLDDWYLFAGPPTSEPRRSECFRLVFE